jgi:ABC-type transporter Mla MlaB component
VQNSGIFNTFYKKEYLSELLQNLTMKNAEILFFPGKKGSMSLKVILKGELTLKNAFEAWDQMVGKLQGINTFEIQTEDVTSVDLAFYQLLISLKKQFQQSGQSISVFLNIPESSEELLKNAGLDINLN